MGLLEVWATPAGKYGIMYSLVCFIPLLLAVVAYYRINYVDRR